MPKVKSSSKPTSGLANNNQHGSKGGIAKHNHKGDFSPRGDGQNYKITMASTPQKPATA